MRKRKRELLLAFFTLLCYISTNLSNGLLLLSANCLAGSPGCSCLWKSGKFSADCAQQNLTRVPKNDYFDFMLANAGNNQMPTLSRDIQQLNLSSNNISSLSDLEFIKKKFRNVQKLFLNENQLLKIHSSAFFKLTGLIELDLSDNLIASFVATNENEKQPDEESSSVQVEEGKGEENNQSKIKTAHTNNNKATNSSSSRETQVREKSFLKDLTQLRVLNMNSNRLTRCDKFTFSPLIQLRQLFLSRNKISFIDKRAFDGLNVLNILHLDGNKLSHLDGGILLKLPQLHAIQLASNPWKCDCKLRKLVRQLALPATSERAHSGEERALVQLQDEPQCSAAAAAAAAGQKQDEVSTTSQEDKQDDRRSWKNMTLADLHCSPRAAEQLLDPIESQRVISITERPDREFSFWPPHPGQKLRLQMVHLVPGEPLELTCAVKLSDELEASEQVLEWWQLESQASSKLPVQLWSSSQAPNNKFISSSPSLAPASSVNKFAVIDYVTRANVTGDQLAPATLNRMPPADGVPNQAATTSSNQKRPPNNEADYEADDDDDDDNNNHADQDQDHDYNHETATSGKNGQELIRVSHLVGVELVRKESASQLTYLCRITNKFIASSSSLDLIYPINVDSPASNERARAQSALRSHLRSSVASFTALPESGPAFTPLHLPAGLDEPLQVATGLDLQMRGPPPLGQNRVAGGPATRQINGTNLRKEMMISLNDDLSHSPQANHDDDHLAILSQMHLNSLIIALTSRFSSNRAHLIRGASRSLASSEQESPSHASSSPQKQAKDFSALFETPSSLWHSNSSPIQTEQQSISLLSDPLTLWIHQLTSSLSGSFHSGASPTPMLLLFAGLCAGLLAGCLLTLGLALRIRGSRVAAADSSSSPVVQLTSSKSTDDKNKQMISSEKQSPDHHPASPPLEGTESSSTASKSPYKLMQAKACGEPLWLLASEGETGDADEELSNNELEIRPTAQSPAALNSYKNLTIERATRFASDSFSSQQHQQQQHTIDRRLHVNELYMPDYLSNTNMLLPIHEAHHHSCTGGLGSNNFNRHHISGSKTLNRPLANYQQQVHDNYPQLHLAQHRQNLIQTHSSSITSPAASTSSTSLTPMTQQQQSQLQLTPLATEHLYAHDAAEGTNLVYLEDALRLLQHSMNDCILFGTRE